MSGERNTYSVAQSLWIWAYVQINSDDYAASIFSDNFFIRRYSSFAAWRALYSLSIAIKSFKKYHRLKKLQLFFINGRNTQVYVFFID